VSAKEAPAPKEPKGIRKPMPITPELQDIVGVSEIPRTQALKLIWAYIKEHELQV
jgi:chromatin remodeling complex protein RSC6